MIGIMSLFLAALVVGTGLKIHNRQSPGLHLGFGWPHTVRIIGWWPFVTSAGLLWFVIYAGRTNILSIQPANAVAVVLPIIVAIQAAFLFSPEDEPALEVMLATPRPPAWILLERLVTLLVMQGGIAVIASLLVIGISGETLIIAIIRWLPLTFILSGLAVYVTLSTHRALFGVVVVSLLWIILALFGDFLVQRWPVTWPLHLYLSPNNAEYLLNRLFISLLGLSLIGLAATRLLNDPERLLLGRYPRKRRPKVDMATGAAKAAKDENIDFNIRPQSIFLRQLGAMVRYEFLLQWRRTALPALVMGLVITPIIGAVVAQSDFQGYSQALANGTLAPEVAKAEITAAMIPMMWLGTALVAMIMVPLLVADTIPKDRQVGVKELLDTLPLSPATYLAGKLFSVWLNLLVALGLTMVIAGLVWRLTVGPFEIGLFLELWIIAAALLIIINAGTALLLAAGQPNTRRAIFVGGIYVLVCLAGLGFIFSTDTGWWRYFNPARPAAMLYYTLGFPGAVTGNDEWTRAGIEFLSQLAGRKDVFISLGVGLLQVGVVWLIAWQWLKRRKL